MFVHRTFDRRPQEIGYRTGLMKELAADAKLLSRLVDEMVGARGGEEALAALVKLRSEARALRSGRLRGGRDALARETAALDTPTLAAIAHAQTQRFHCINAAEEQHRIRTLRRRDKADAPALGSIHGACVELREAGVTPDEVRALLSRLFVMPVLTAHPTEARRRTVIDHLAQISLDLDALDDPRRGDEERARTIADLRESIAALYCTEEARATRPTPLDEVRAGLHVFERTLLDVTPEVVRALEDSLARVWPRERFTVGSFLRWGTWIGGDRDGNPNVTADVTRAALERHRALAIDRAIQDALMLGRELSVSARKVDAAALGPLVASIERDRALLPDLSRQGRGEPWREKLNLVRARLEATRVRGDAGYPDVAAYKEDLALLARTLSAATSG
jgi:phosphoenolpyruvate carboxylase